MNYHTRSFSISKKMVENPQEFAKFLSAFPEDFKLYKLEDLGEAGYKLVFQVGLIWGEEKLPIVNRIKPTVLGNFYIIVHQSEGCPEIFLSPKYLK